MVRYPGVARRCCEVAAMWVAGEAATLCEGQTLRRNEDDILPGLAQAVREYGVDLAEMARECGIDPIDLRRKVALSRFGELLKTGEIWSLSDQALESKLQQAAREYSLEVEQLLDEISHPCALTPSTGAALTVTSKAVKIAWLLRCWTCRRLQRQRYRIDFTPQIVGEIRFLSEPVYACHHCLPMHLSDQQVQQILRLSESEIPNSPGVRMRSAAFAAVAILVFSSCYIRGAPRRATQECASCPRPLLPQNWSVRSRLRVGPRRCPPNPARKNLQPPRLFQHRLRRYRRLSHSSPVASGSQASGIVTAKQHEIAAASVVRPPDIGRAQGSQRLRDQSGRQASYRATALNDCREILHNERPLVRYSIRDAAQDADHEAVSVAEACARTTMSLAQRGNECAGLFSWFEVFQTKLTNGCSLRLKLGSRTARLVGRLRLRPSVRRSESSVLRTHSASIRQIFGSVAFAIYKGCSGLPSALVPMQ